MAEDSRPDWPAPGETNERKTGRWYGVGALGIIAAALGVLADSPGLLLVGGVGAALAGYVRLSAPPAVALELDRQLSESSPEPGDAVTVSLTVRNAGDALLPELRVVDGVPSGLAVVDGSPRLGTALRPDAAATVEYEVRAAAGEHRFRPTFVAVRDAAGAAERATRVEASGPDLSVAPEREEATVPLRGRTGRQAGTATASTGGAGVEFHAVREYRRGDPRARIDWSRLARTGEFSTVEFRRERAATVVVVVDARPAAALAPDAATPTAVERGVEAAGRIVAGLARGDHRVGLTALAADPPWLAPGTGRAHRARARDLLATSPALADPTGPVDLDAESRRLRARLRADAQVVLVSPACDDGVARLVRRLEATGHPVTLVSPDPTADGSPGRTLARLERDERLRALRRAGVPVLDWPPGESLAASLADAGWSG